MQEGGVHLEQQDLLGLHQPYQPERPSREEGATDHEQEPIQPEPRQRLLDRETHSPPEDSQATDLRVEEQPVRHYRQG